MSNNRASKRDTGEIIAKIEGDDLTLNFHSDYPESIIIESHGLGESIMVDDVEIDDLIAKLQWYKENYL